VSWNINSYLGFAETLSLSKDLVSYLKCQLTAALGTQKQVLCKVEVVILINELSQQRKCECIFYAPEFLLPAELKF
jgi:hypothetical protein